MELNDLQILQEEIFCLKFELEALANVSIRQESERWVPGFINQITEHSHLNRYKLACNYSKNKKILDIACGVGKGAYLLATLGEADFVTGGDIEEEAIRYANHRNKSSNVKFCVENAETFRDSNAFDLIVSFETIEHLNNYHVFLLNIQTAMKMNGIFIVSTPISHLPINNSPSNPYHIQEWGFDAFQSLLKKYFSIEKVFVQLYQNAFLNEKINVKKSSKLLNKVLSYRYKNRSSNIEHWNSHSNYSIIEEYTNQYDINKLGKDYLGYQIVICKLK